MNLGTIFGLLFPLEKVQLIHSTLLVLICLHSLYNMEVDFKEQTVKHSKQFQIVYHKGASEIISCFFFFSRLRDRQGQD